METEAERVANKRADAKQSQKTKLMEKQPWISNLAHTPLQLHLVRWRRFDQKAQTCLSRQKEEVMIKIDLATV
jgi:hypothetical protein